MARGNNMAITFLTMFTISWTVFSVNAVCGPPTRVDLATFYPAKNLYQPGETVTYSCTPPLMLVGGSEQFTCLRSAWQGTLPECGVFTDIKVIKQFVQFLGGVSKPAHTSLEACLTECRRSRTCQSADWQFAQRRCVHHSASDCSTNLRYSLDAGTTHYGFCFGRCSSCATNKGACVSQWDWRTNNNFRCGCYRGNTGADCSLDTCRIPSVNSVHLAVPSKPVYLPGETIQLACKPGYRFPDGALFKRVTCGTSRGQFNPPLPPCSPLKCDVPYLGANVERRHKGDLTVGQVELISCKDGYMFPNGQKHSSVTCQSNGLLDRVVHTCVQLICPLPLRDYVHRGNNATEVLPKGKYNYRDVAFVTCTHGLAFPNGKSTMALQCQANGTFTPPLPYCGKYRSARIGLGVIIAIAVILLILLIIIIIIAIVCVVKRKKKQGRGVMGSAFSDETLCRSSVYGEAFTLTRATDGMGNTYNSNKPTRSPSANYDDASSVEISSLYSSPDKSKKKNKDADQEKYFHYGNASDAKPVSAVTYDSVYI